MFLKAHCKVCHLLLININVIDLFLIEHYRPSLLSSVGGVNWNFDVGGLGGVSQEIGMLFNHTI